VPGVRSSRRNWPWASEARARERPELGEVRVMPAEAMRAWVASCTVPRREPREFCAAALKAAVAARRARVRVPRSFRVT